MSEVNQAAERLRPSYEWLLQYFQQDTDHKLHLILMALSVAANSGRSDLAKEYRNLAAEIRCYRDAQKQREALQ